MKYKVENEIFDDVDDAIEFCIDSDYHEDDDYFETWVNECYGEIQICGRTYSAYDILDNAGDISDALSDYCSEQNQTDREEARYEIEHAKPGDEIYCQNYVIEIIEDEETEETDEFTNLESLTAVREFIKEQQMMKNIQSETEKKEEEDIMSLFQKIGG